MQPVPQETPEVKRELAKSNFPDIEGDTSPHAIVPKACSSIQKQVTKMENLIAAFKKADSLSSLQTKKLVDISVVF